MRKDSVKEGTSAFLLVEYGCVKISVALLRQPFQPFFSFFRKISYMRSKISVALLRHPFSAFFLKIL